MKIRLTGAPPYDGDYPIDLSKLTNRDIHTIKTVSGYTPLEYGQVLTRGDTDFFVALAIIALRRSGHVQVVEDAIWDAPAGAIDIVIEESDKGDAVPPPGVSASGQNGSSTPSGTASNTDSGIPSVPSPASTGTP